MVNSSTGLGQAPKISFFMNFKRSSIRQFSEFKSARRQDKTSSSYLSAILLGADLTRASFPGPRG